MSPGWLRVVLVAGVAAWTGALAWLMQHRSYDLWAPLLFIPVLFALSAPVLVRAARREPDPEVMTRILVGAMVAKLTASILRYVVMSAAYDGGDFRRYNTVGAELARAYRQGAIPFTDLLPSGPSTQFIEKLTGLVYSFVGWTMLGGFVLYAWLGFWGLFFFYRAGRLAFPEADPKRYALLVFFLPSLVFWPSSIGKDAWMQFALGFTAYGAARLLSRRRGAVPVLAIGLWATTAVRPHLTVIAVIALTVAFLFRRGGGRASALGPVGEVVGVAVLLAALVFAANRAVGIFNLSLDDGGSVTRAFNETERRTSKGDGSVVDTARPSSPADYPRAVLAVLFRPTLLDVRNPQQAVAALEGTFLLWLCWQSRRRLLRVPVAAARRAYVTYALVFTGVFVFAFSAIGNLGILARQRTMVLPLFLLLLCVPEKMPQASSRPSSVRTPARPVAGTTLP